MTEIETIEGEVEEQIGQALEVRGEPEVELFSGPPVERVRQMQEVAEVLADILRKQKLTKNIQGKEHVLAEGWTTLAALIGVTTGIDWTRRVSEPAEGWEARAVVYLRGIPISSAESECLRSENMWGYTPTGQGGKKLQVRDDHALRSMAQTRATSKALKTVLGFIVTLAGFEATPAEEIPADATERRVEGPGEFPVPQTWPQIEKAVKAVDDGERGWVIFQAFLRAASYHLFGEADPAKLKGQKATQLRQKAAGAVCFLHDHPELTDQAAWTIFSEDAQRKAWAAVLDGTVLETPDLPPEEPDPEEVEAAEEAAKAAEREA